MKVGLALGALLVLDLIVRTDTTFEREVVEVLLKALETPGVCVGLLAGGYIAYRLLARRVGRRGER